LPLLRHYYSDVRRRPSTAAFHAVYGEHEAFIELETGHILYGYLPATALRLVQTWLAQHREELNQDWKLAEQLRPLEKIAPLD
jgi:hypothetical protein